MTHFAVGVDDPEASLTAAAGMGYVVEGDTVAGPDGYKFRLLPHEPSRAERFVYVGLRVGNLPKAVEFYGDVLGMNDLTWDFEYLAFNRGGTDLMRVVGYSPDQVPLMLFEDPMTKEELKLEQWEGRNALSVPESALRGAYQELTEKLGDKGIIHDIREFNEALGKLVVAIVRDVDGYELCLVSSETFDKAIAAAYNPGQEIDWAWREKAASGDRVPQGGEVMGKCV